MDTDYYPIVGELFNNAVSYKVPLYQRHYVWNSINWRHLWDDIEEKSELRRKNVPKDHFTGAVVIQEIHPDALIEIIDGQQRLTTFQIILCAVRDLCNEFVKDPMDVQGKIDDYIFLPSLTPITIPLNFDGQYKLLPREGTDRDVFLSLVERDHEHVETSSLIWKAYLYFKDKIRTYVNNNYDTLHMLHDSIVGDFQVVTITVTSEDEYAKIFKSINGTGRRLDQFDLLRNDLFLRAGGTERDNLYRTYWSHFEEDPNWREPKMVDKFLTNFLKVKLKEDFDEQLSLFDQYEIYCMRLTKELNLCGTNPQLVKYEFYDLSQYSSVYYDIHITNSGEIAERIKFYDQFKDKLNVVDLLKLFILYITNEFGLSTPELDRIFNLFEAYVVREMLYIGSKGYNSPPLRKLNDLFLSTLNRKLRALDRNKSLSFINLVHMLFGESATNQDVKVALERLPETETSRMRKKKKTSPMREFGGSYIFDVLGWGINKSKLFDRFCDKWPSAEVMIQKELIGELPIVYSRMPVCVETIGNLQSNSESHAFAQAVPRLENYVFVTYQGMIELSKYDIDENIIMGEEVNSKVENILDLKEILFAFPATAMSSMQNHINRTRDDVKDQKLNPDSTQEVFDPRNWLFNERPELKTIVEDSNYEHWLLPNIKGAAVVTRAGHELRGTLKSFSDRAIYLEINEHIVTVYTQGIFNLEWIQKTHGRK